MQRHDPPAPAELDAFAAAATAIVRPPAAPAADVVQVRSVDMVVVPAPASRLGFESAFVATLVTPANAPRVLDIRGRRDYFYATALSDAELDAMLQEAAPPSPRGDSSDDDGTASYSPELRLAGALSTGNYALADALIGRGILSQMWRAARCGRACLARPPPPGEEPRLCWACMTTRLVPPALLAGWRGGGGAHGLCAVRRAGEAFHPIRDYAPAPRTDWLRIEVAEPALRPVAAAVLRRAAHLYESAVSPLDRFALDTVFAHGKWLRLPRRADGTALAWARNERGCLEARAQWDALAAEEAAEEARPRANAPEVLMGFDIESINPPGVNAVPRADRGGRVFQIGVNFVSSAAAGDEAAAAEVLLGLGATAPLKRWGAAPPPHKRVFCWPVSEAGERALLEAFVRLVHGVDPDRLMSYNGAGYDVPFLWRRAELLGADCFARIGRHAACTAPLREVCRLSKQKGKRIFYDVDIVGRSLFDAMMAVRDNARLPHYGLGAVARRFLGGQDKEDVDAAQISTLYYAVEAREREAAAAEAPLAPAKRGAPDGAGNADAAPPKDPAELRANAAAVRSNIGSYCVKDAWLVTALVHKLKYTAMYQALSAMCRLNVGRYLGGTSTEKGAMMILAQARADGFLLSDERQVSDGQYAGAFVHQLVDLDGNYTGGMDDDAALVLDFASLYPSIIRAMNMCYSTYLPGGAAQAAALGVPCHRTPTGHFFVKAAVREGVLPRLLGNVLGTRARVKGMMKRVARGSVEHETLDAWQLACKILANSIYGLMGAKASRIAMRAIAESITAIGQRLMKGSIAFAAVEYGAMAGLVDCYGDTDSFFVKLRGARDLRDVMAVGHHLEAAINAFLDEWAAANGLGVGVLRHEFEKVFTTFLLFKRKKYVGLKMLPPPFDAALGAALDAPYRAGFWTFERYEAWAAAPPAARPPPRRTPAQQAEVMAALRRRAREAWPAPLAAPCTPAAIDYNGVEVKRRENSLVVRNAMVAIYERLMGVSADTRGLGVQDRLRAALDVAREHIRRVRHGDFPIEHFVRVAGFAKSVDEYAAGSVSVGAVVAQRIMAADASRVVHPGERLCYLMVQKGPRRTRRASVAPGPSSSTLRIRQHLAAGGGVGDLSTHDRRRVVRSRPVHGGGEPALVVLQARSSLANSMQELSSLDKAEPVEHVIQQNMEVDYMEYYKELLGPLSKVFSPFFFRTTEPPSRAVALNPKSSALARALLVGDHMAVTRRRLTVGGGGAGTLAGMLVRRPKCSICDRRPRRPRSRACIECDLGERGEAKFETLRRARAAEGVRLRAAVRAYNTIIGNCIECTRMTLGDPLLCSNAMCSQTMRGGAADFVLRRAGQPAAEHTARTVMDIEDLAAHAARLEAEAAPVEEQNLYIRRMMARYEVERVQTQIDEL